MQGKNRETIVKTVRKTGEQFLTYPKCNICGETIHVGIPRTYNNANSRIERQKILKEAMEVALLIHKQSHQ